MDWLPYLIVGGVLGIGLAAVLLNRRVEISFSARGVSIRVNPSSRGSSSRSESAAQ